MTGFQHFNGRFMGRTSQNRSKTKNYTGANYSYDSCPARTRNDGFLGTACTQEEYPRRRLSFQEEHAAFGEKERTSLSFQFDVVSLYQLI